MSNTRKDLARNLLFVEVEITKEGFLEMGKVYVSTNPTHPNEDCGKPGSLLKE